MRWWLQKIRQAVRYFTARNSADARAELAEWLTPEQLRLFDSMHPVDRRHGVDVMRRLRAAGYSDPGLLLAGLFHDAGKGRGSGVVARVGWALGKRYGTWAMTPFRVIPSVRVALDRLRDHVERSAQLALAAGCPPRTAEFIRTEVEPRDELTRALREADDRS